MRRVDLAKWALRTSPKFTTGVKWRADVEKDISTILRNSLFVSWNHINTFSVYLLRQELLSQKLMKMRNVLNLTEKVFFTWLQKVDMLLLKMAHILFHVCSSNASSIRIFDQIRDPEIPITLRSHYNKLFVNLTAKESNRPIASRLIFVRRDGFYCLSSGIRLTRFVSSLAKCI